KKDMAAGQQADQQPLDEMFLANDNLSKFIPEWGNPPGTPADRFIDLLYGGIDVGGGCTNFCPGRGRKVDDMGEFLKHEFSPNLL
ncbi:hypothetical protein JZU69_05570, partial [bacterium]|nr:hypothetical protein [bacterium]